MIVVKCGGEGETGTVRDAPTTEQQLRTDPTSHPLSPFNKEGVKSGSSRGQSCAFAITIFLCYLTFRRTIGL